MQIREREAGAVTALRKPARTEREAEQRGRYLVPAHAIAGMKPGDIQRALARSRGFVQRWASAYRDGGIEALALLEIVGPRCGGCLAGREVSGRLWAALSGPRVSRFDGRLSKMRQSRRALPRATISSRSCAQSILRFPRLS